VAGHVEIGRVVFDLLEGGDLGRPATRSATPAATHWPRGATGQGALDRFERSQMWLEERLDTTGLARTTLRRVFPDHRSFPLDGIALYCLVVKTRAKSPAPP
jgi:hypothetical protein